MNDFAVELKKFEYFMRIKAELVVKGVSVDNQVERECCFNTKQIHLFILFLF